MKVKVFSTKQCPYCRMTKDFLDKHNVQYEDIDVGENEAAAKEMIEKSGQMGVPVIEIIGDNGKSEIIIGFNVNRLKSVLKIED